MWRNYKYTIILCLVIAIALIGVIGLAKQASDCEDKGGTYVKSWTGWEYKCIGAKK